MNKVSKIFLVGLMLSVLVAGCLKDKITPVTETSLNDSATLLFFLEDGRDYFNSSSMPSFVSADEVDSNLQTYLLLDIRSPEEFAAGHIAGAQNIPHSGLISYLQNTDSFQYAKIIIISGNGQSSAFYTCLLQLYGYENIYSLEYGMASWNMVFAGQWLDAIDNKDLSRFTSDIVSKPGYTPLPGVELGDGNLFDAVQNRIRDILNTDYEDNLTGTHGTATIDYSYLVSAEISLQYYIICYNSGPLYKDFISGIGHPPGAVRYTPPPSGIDLSSASYLQTIPSQKKIAIYSTDGQLSAFAAAYLRVLGYDAQSVMFGANNIFYTLLAAAPGLSNEAFSESKIRDYPFVTGN